MFPLSGGHRPGYVPGFAISPFGLDVPLSRGTSAVTIPGFAINPFGLDVPLSRAPSAVTIPGFAINPFGLNVPLSEAQAVTIPASTIPDPPELDRQRRLGPINIRSNITKRPGLPETPATVFGPSVFSCVCVCIVLR